MSLALPYLPWHQAWFDILRHLLRSAETAPRGLKTAEQMNLSFTVPAAFNILDVPARNLNYRFMVAEWLWIAAGFNAVMPVARYNSLYANFSDDGVRMSGAYGPPIAEQWAYVRGKLEEDPSTRQAVLTIWRPRPAPSRDIPCTVALQFLYRGDQLHLTATMRSSDAWLGLPYDVFVFGQLLSAMAGELDVERGTLHMQLGSSHLYQRDLKLATEVLQHPGTSLASPPLPGRVPPEALVRLLLLGEAHVCPGLLHPWNLYANVLASRTSAQAFSFLDLHEATWYDGQTV